MDLRSGCPYWLLQGGPVSTLYGGNGITFSLIAAEIIRDTLLNRPNSDSRIFSFER